MAALLDLCRAAPSLAGVVVHDGGPVTDLSEQDQLFIGWSPDDAIAATMTQDFASAGARRRDEDFTILGYAESRAGDTDLAARRVRVFALLAAVEDALRATDTQPNAPTLNGSVLWAHLTQGVLAQPQTPDGALAGVTFTVACKARL
jgi:hypothetical protein